MDEAFIDFIARSTQSIRNINMIAFYRIFMSNVEISDMVVKKFKDIVQNDREFKMIMDLLENEKYYNQSTDPNVIKRQFQLLLEQYFPIGEEDE